MASELLANNFAVQLASGCAQTDTTITVTAAAPTALQSGQFRVLIDQEYMLVTGGASTTTWNVTRGAGTGEPVTPTQVSHQSGSWVTHVLTAGALFGGNLGSVVSASSATGKTLPLQPVSGVMGVYNVLDFGAKCDGATDDLTAINAAIAAASAVGAGIVVIPGMSAVSGTVNVPSFVQLWGTSLPYLSGEVSKGALGEIYTGGLQFTSGGAKNYALIANTNTGALGDASIELHRLRLYQTGTASDVPIVDFTRTWRCRINECNLWGDATTSRLGVRLNGDCEENWITRNKFDGRGLTGAAASNINTPHISDNEFDAAGIALLAGSFNAQISHNDLYCNSIAAGAGFAAWPNGIKLAGAIEAQVHDNNIIEFQNDGIALLNTLRANVHDNVIMGNSRQTAGTWGGILIDSFTNNPTSENWIHHNHCYDRQGSPTQGYGVRIFSSNANQTANNLFDSNDFRGNTHAVAVNVNANLGANNVFRNNAGYNPVGSITLPTFPATTVAATPSDRYDCTVFITNGTSAITQIAVGGTNTGMNIAASGWAAIRVPAGQTIAFTYAGGTPSWVGIAE